MLSSHDKRYRHTTVSTQAGYSAVLPILAKAPLDNHDRHEKFAAENPADVLFVPDHRAPEVPSPAPVPPPV